MNDAIDLTFDKVTEVVEHFDGKVPAKTIRDLCKMVRDYGNAEIYAVPDGFRVDVDFDIW